jgi:hypothetical protein
MIEQLTADEVARIIDLLEWRAVEWVEAPRDVGSALDKFQRMAASTTRGLWLSTERPGPS